MIKVLPCRFPKCLGPFKMLTVEGCSKTGLLRHFNCLQPFSVFTVEGCSEMGLLRHLPNRVSPRVSFRIYISYYDHRFFFNLKLNLNFGNTEKGFVSQITAFELVAENCLYYEENTFHRQSMC